jgi:hypothetical protein
LLIRHKDLPETNRKKYIYFLKNSAEILWTTGSVKTPVILFGYHWWQAPTETKAALRTQLSACMLMEALALLKAEGYIEK